MRFAVDLDYTPRSPQAGVPFTEASFVRRSQPFTFDVKEVGMALVDLWNFGWEDGPVGETLGPELSLERGVSHAQRKRWITEQIIGPTVAELRGLGVQIFHCNHSNFLERYPQWTASTTEEEREAERARHAPVAEGNCAPVPATAPADKQDTWPPPDWVKTWRDQYTDAVYNDDWMSKQSKEVYWKIDIPEPVKPRNGDLLTFSGEHFHRLLTKKRIRVLFFMGFEATECLQFSPYGMANMQQYGYLCVVVRDATTTYEMAETLAGLWRTRTAIIHIEGHWGYSVDSQRLVNAVQARVEVNADRDS